MTNRRIFIRQLGFGIAGAGAMLSAPSYAFTESKKKFSLPRSSAEEQGMSSAGIISFLDAVEKSKVEFHSIMIIRHGHVVAEGWWSPYGPSLKHTLYSLSKAFTSTAVGIAVKEGKLTVEDPVTSFFPDDLPKEISPNLAAMKVKHLLTMSTGHTKDTMPALRDAAGVPWVKSFLGQPVEAEPGTHFLYNTGATYTLSAIIQKLTGQTLMEYLKPRLFEPLGIEGMDWETDPQGINTGGYGLRVRTEDIARFGLLYLQKGKWNGKEILTESWVEAATSKQVESSPSNPSGNNNDSDWGQGYGYQFWRCKPGGYRGDGAFGQFCVVMPDKDLVIAATSESFDMQASMRLMWTHLLPAIIDSNTSVPDINSQKLVVTKLRNLSLPPLLARAQSPIQATISGKEYTLEQNPFSARSLSFSFTGDRCVLTVTDDRGKHVLDCGMNTWLKEKKGPTPTLFAIAGRTEIPSLKVASATWTDEKTLTISLRLTEFAHNDQYIFSFDDKKVSLKFSNSVSRGNTSNPEKRADIAGARD